MAYPQHEPARRGAGEPGPARGRAARARLLGRRQDLRGQRRGARRRRERRQRVRLLRRPAVRQRPAALRPPAHRLRQGRGAALPDHARPAGRAPLRLGLPRPARRGRGREAARHHHQGRDPRRWAWTSSTRPAAPRCCAYTQDWERYVTRQARWVDFANDYKTLDLDYMESVMWAFKTLHDKGLVYEGFRVLAYCWRCETPLSNTETRMDDVYRDRQDPALTVWFAAATTRREASRSGPPRRGRCRPTWRSRSAPTSSTRCCETRRRARTSSARRGWLRTPRSWRATSRSARCSGARPGRAPLHAAVRLPGRAGRAERLPGARRRTSSPPRTAPASCTWRPAFGEDDQNACNAAGIPTVVTVDDHTRFTALVPPYAGHAGLRGQQAGHPRPQGARRGAAARHLHPLVPALLALRHPAGLQGGVVAGSSR